MGFIGHDVLFMKGWTMHQELLTVKEVALMLSLSVRSVLRMDKAGTIPKSFTIGRARRWSANVITDWIRNGCPKMGGKS
jgi:excisionase family DNA binding protein